MPYPISTEHTISSPTTLYDSKSVTSLPNLTSSLGNYVPPSQKIRETLENSQSLKGNSNDFLRFSINHNVNTFGKEAKTPNNHVHRKMTYDNVTTEEPKKNMQTPNIHKNSQRMLIKKNTMSPHQKTPTKKNPEAPEPSPNSSKTPPKTSNKVSLPIKVQRTKTNIHTPTRSAPLQFTKTKSPVYSKTMNGFSLGSSTDLMREPNRAPKESAQSWIHKKALKIEDFHVGRLLGEGKFGSVYFVVHKKSNAIYALKKVKKENIVKNKLENQFIMEIKMQLHLNHPNILKLYGFFADQENIYLILEYMEEGTLYGHLRREKSLEQADASKKLRDILSGVAYLHSKQIAHRDIKPENIVMSNVTNLLT